MNLDNLKIDPTLLGEEEPDFNPALAYKEAKLDLYARPERPPIAISIGEDPREYNGEHYPIPFGTYGNISLIKGEEKSRKSFLKSLILACSIGGNANNFSEDIKGHDIKDRWIIEIDTEQDDYYCALNGARVVEMVGQVPKNYQLFKLRAYSQPQRRAFLKWLFKESPIKDKLAIVFIDGFVDFVRDFNDNIDCSDFTQELMTYTKTSMCHISGILHLNPGQAKGRGHLGTILQQKCETVVVIKDFGTTSEVACQRGRGKRWETFEIEINDRWLPFVTDKDENYPI